MSGENEERIPRHIAVIMDGNGRWAKARNLPRSAGHKAGADNFREIAIYAKSRGVKYFTVYAFSTENWKRSADEIEAIMKILGSFLDTALKEWRDYGIRVKIVGDIAPLSETLKKKIREVEAVTEGFEPICSICLNYGGRADIVQAANRAFEKHGAPISEEQLGAELYTNLTPDPDLVIRTSGELRISNFLLWQTAYSEFYFTDKLWPEFSKEDLDAAIAAYARRDRRYGGRK